MPLLINKDLHSDMQVFVLPLLLSFSLKPFPLTIKAVALPLQLLKKAGCDFFSRRPFGFWIRAFTLVAFLLISITCSRVVSIIQSVIFNYITIIL